MLEALRHGDPQSKSIPGFTHVAEEAADLMIRLLDFCGARGIPLGAAVLAKHAFNQTRPRKHGKAF